MPEGDVAEEECGVEGVVELRKVAIDGPHSAAAIEEKDEGLVALFAKFPRDNDASPRGGLPVDLRKHVTILIVAQLMKLAALARDVFGDDAHLAGAVAHGKERVADDGFVVGIDFHFRALPNPVCPLPKPEWRCLANVARCKCDRATLGGRGFVCDARHSPALHRTAPWKMLAGDGGRQPVEELGSDRGAVGIVQPNRDFILNPKGKSSGKLALQSHAFAHRHEDGVRARDTEQ